MQTKQEKRETALKMRERELKSYQQGPWGNPEQMAQRIERKKTEIANLRKKLGKEPA